ncbi:MAG: hypothetical protein A3G04_02675 [Candidatus Taylorbacteria bacterium RIFCSPLOWO2_12_FULL_44_9]|nr:MAG: hypothetical protein A3G04_02675 [Candidatus Taylorbacteria bacterium RIFCSPLOWO2_12_FULL_44_9]
MMKSLALISIFVGFAGISLFGSFLISHSMVDHMPCVVSVMTGVSCPTNRIDFAAHHISALQVLSNSPVLVSDGLLLFVIFLAATLFLAFLGKNFLLFPKIFLNFSLRETKEFCFSVHNLTRWLALFEHSPSF